MLNGILVLPTTMLNTLLLSSIHTITTIPLSVFNLGIRSPRAYTSCVIPQMSRCEQMLLDDTNTSYQYCSECLTFYRTMTGCGYKKRTGGVIDKICGDALSSSLQNRRSKTLLEKCKEIEVAKELLG